MGVYVKGMEMPNDCMECPFSDYEAWCLIPGVIQGHCPLVEVPEPHGDLIDRDILEQELINGIRAGNYEEGYEHYAHINNMDDCVECVMYADTVIEAEGSNDTRKAKGD